MIRIENLRKEYHTGESVVKALKGINLEIESGEFTAIAGPSGSGKTTLLNLIGCIDGPDAGRVLFGNDDVTAMTKRELVELRRHRLGFIFQAYNLIPVLTAFENVALPLNLLNTPANETKERVMQLLSEVGLDGMEHRKPAKLSGGQQQRVAIARALIKNPAVILADEPTANLDSHTGEDILQLMKKMNEKHGTTFIFSTHDKMVMDFADRLVRLHDGEITGDERRS